MKRRFEPSKTSRPASRHRPSYQNLATRCKYISETPFAYGAFRSVCEGEYTEGRQSGEPCVLKKFIKGGVFEDRYFSEDIKAVGRSKDIIHAFNTAGFVNKTMYMNEAAVWRHLEPDANGRHECVLVEPKIEGEFVKFNSNTGYTNGADVMQALSHFSYHHTNGQEVLCDLQGGRYDTCYVLTDPVIMSRTGTYGTTDLGARHFELLLPSQVQPVLQGPLEEGAGATQPLQQGCRNNDDGRRRSCRLNGHRRSRGWHELSASRLASSVQPFA